jgi:hypothetical protein
MLDSEFSIRAVLDDDECERFPDACLLASTAFEHWRSPFVCEHVFDRAELERQPMFQCGEHPETILCWPCMELHSATGHSTDLPHCMIPACVAPIVGLSRIELVIEAGWVLGAGETRARLASGVSNVYATLCHRHGSRHIWDWNVTLNALADDGVTWDAWVERPASMNGTDRA